MINRFHLIWLFGFFPLFLFAQELTQIEILRDKWGVPHIYAPTDEEVCYGLAWAQCEDDFQTLQEQMLAVQGRYGEYAGKDGIVLDFAVQFMGFREVVEARYEKDISPKVRRMLASYTDGINNYAAAHPEECLLKGKFQLSAEDLVVGYMLGVTQLTGATKDLLAILDNSIEALEEEAPRGSNAIAISGRKTTTGETFLAINSHQPMEGWYSWYEAHLGSAEGWNILGGTFAGGITIFHGANEHLGWAHTVNHPDFSDVFQLEMHPTKKLHYKFDGAWLPLKEKKYKAKLKIAGLKIPIARTIYESKYGPSFKTKDNRFYAWRFVSGLEIAAPEQWYRMNRATNLEEFQAALALQGLVCTNIAYADKEDNIYYISNGKLPARAEAYDWKGVLPGNTSATLWMDDFVPIEELPQVLNPKAGYVFNTNNSPFNSTASEENPKETARNERMGYQETGIENNRSQRFADLIAQYDKLSWEDFKAIKFDRNYPSKLETAYIQNLELLLQLDPTKYPYASDAIRLLNNWDRNTDLENESAVLFFTCLDKLNNNLRETRQLKRGDRITESEAITAIRAAKEQLLEDFEKLAIPLAQVQMHQRGNVKIPLAGGPDVLAAIYSRRQEDGRRKAFAGDCYIQLVRFSETEVHIESVNVYGASAKADSPHYTDQMRPFAEQQLKPMSLDWEKVRAAAVRKYHPLRVLEKMK